MSYVLSAVWYVITTTSNIGIIHSVCSLFCWLHQVLQQTSDQEMILYSDVKEQSHPVAQGWWYFCGHYLITSRVYWIDV